MNRLPLPAIRSWLLVLVALVLVLASALAVVYSSYETRRLVATHQRLQQENDAMQVEWGQLLLEQSTWGSYNRVEQLAGTRLNMKVPAPNEIVMVEP
ncbi:MAG: cell division protein FtsL [Pseudomonadales bacterium]|nr:cell division protein FtsL [Pseudomonadales bacterium]